MVLSLYVYSFVSPVLPLTTITFITTGELENDIANKKWFITEENKNKNDSVWLLTLLIVLVIEHLNINKETYTLNWIEKLYQPLQIEYIKEKKNNFNKIKLKDNIDDLFQLFYIYKVFFHIK